MFTIKILDLNNLIIKSEKEDLNKNDLELRKMVKEEAKKLSPLFDERNINKLSTDGNNIIVILDKLSDLFIYSEYSEFTNQFILYDEEKNVVRQVPLNISVFEFKNIEQREWERRRKRAELTRKRNS